MSKRIVADLSMLCGVIEDPDDSFKRPFVGSVEVEGQGNLSLGYLYSDHHEDIRITLRSKRGLSKDLRDIAHDSFCEVTNVMKGCSLLPDLVNAMAKMPPRVSAEIAFSDDPKHD